MVWSFILLSQWNTLVARFSGLAEDGGSGRHDFYQLLYDRWYDADLFHWLFGFGFWSAQDYLGRVWLAGIYAHSDLLEMLHDHGFIGLLAYSLILFGYFFLCRHSWRNRDEGLIVFLPVSSLFLATGLISGNIMFHETIYYMMPLAYMIGRLEKTNLSLTVMDRDSLFNEAGAAKTTFPEEIVSGYK